MKVNIENALLQLQIFILSTNIIFDFSKKNI
jgi:hypothetical protein